MTYQLCSLIKSFYNEYIIDGMMPLDELEEKWQDDSEQYELVKNHLKTKIDNYIILIISPDNDIVLKTIKENFT